MTALALVIAPEAQQDLRDVYLYSKRTWGERQAGVYLGHIKACFWLLTTQPNAGPLRPELGHEVQSFVIKRHVVFYRRQLNQLQIVRVLHGRQDPELPA